MKNPRRLHIVSLYLWRDQWTTMRRLGRERGLGKRGGAIVLREALDQYLNLRRTAQRLAAKTAQAAK